MNTHQTHVEGVWMEPAIQAVCSCGWRSPEFSTFDPFWVRDNDVRQAQVAAADHRAAEAALQEAS